MNLREFLNFREKCPFCNTGLSLCFNAIKSKRTIKITNNNIIITIPLRNIKKRTYVYANVICNLDSNNISVDFYNNTISYHSSIPIEYIKTISKLLIKTRNNIYKHCNNCKYYTYNSSPILFSKNSLYQASIQNEYFGLTEIDNNMYKTYKIFNNFTTNSSTIIYGRSNSKSAIEWDQVSPYGYSKDQILKTGLILVNNQTNILDKLKTILIFS